MSDKTTRVGDGGTASGTPSPMEPPGRGGNEDSTAANLGLPNDAIETAGWEESLEAQRSLTVRCLQCGKEYEIAGHTPAAEVACPHCEAHFNLENRPEETRIADAVRTVGHFKLIERSGRGSFGEVWKAHDCQLDRTVAVKLPRFGRLSNEDVDLLLREARAAAGLSHPNIVRVHETGRDGSSVFIVSEYVRGVTLADLLSGKGLSIDESVNLAAKAADALHHAHESGVIHRDVKPANIMVDESMSPRLMDFGLARQDRAEDTLSADGQMMGTPAYMSPEQARGEGRKADHRTDIYSLGAVLYELVTGERPFRGNAAMQVHQVVRDTPQPPRKLNADVPRDLETIIMKCLEKEAGRRYSSAAELAADLRNFAEGRPVSARPASAIGRAARWYQRNPRALAITAGAHLSLTMLLLFLWTVYAFFSLAIGELVVENQTQCLAEFAVLCLLAYPLAFVLGLATIQGYGWGLWLGFAVGVATVVLTSAAVADPDSLLMQLGAMQNLKGERYAELQITSLLSLIAITILVLHTAALAVKGRTHTVHNKASRLRGGPTSLLSLL